MNFASYHPALNLLFFVAVIAFTACWTHPGLVAVSFLCALAFSVRLRGPRAVAFGCALVAAALAFAALFALNVHFGVTNLARTPIGNSITVESLTCGLIVGIKVAAILVWLSCVMCVFTADKVVFLLGSVFPKAAMMLGEQRVYYALRLFGFGSKTGLPFPLETRGLLPPVRRWDGLSITRFPIGYGVRVSPLQMLRAYCALANGGKLPTLRLIDRIVDPETWAVTRMPVPEPVPLFDHGGAPPADRDDDSRDPAGRNRGPGGDSGLRGGGQDRDQPQIHSGAGICLGQIFFQFRRICSRPFPGAGHAGDGR